MAFTDQGEFEAMKTPIGCRAPRCDEDQFRAKMMVNNLTDYKSRNAIDAIWRHRYG